MTRLHGGKSLSIKRMSISEPRYCSSCWATNPDGELPSTHRRPVNVAVSGHLCYSPLENTYRGIRDASFLCAEASEMDDAIESAPLGQGDSTAIGALIATLTRGFAQVTNGKI